MAGKPRNQVKTDRPQPAGMSIKATPLWLDWLDGLRAQYSRVPRTNMIDIALAEAAKKVSYNQAPPRY